MSDLVSVIIPSFDRGHVVREAVDSVLGQLHGHVEVIVVDDGSSDATREIVETAYGDEPRVRYRYQPNAGASSARNTGLDLATGDYVAFLDSDDSWKPWHLSLLLACLQRYPEAGLIWADIDAVDANGTVICAACLRDLLSAYRYFTMDELFSVSSPLADLGVDIPTGYTDNRLYVGDVFSPMVMGNLVLTSSVVMRRRRLEQVGRFNERIVTGEDYEFFLRACRVGAVAYADIPDTRYRVGTTDRLSGRAMGLPMARGYLHLLEATLARDADRITLSQDMIAEARTYAHRWVGEQQLQAGSRRLARGHFALALRIGPSRPLLVALLLLTLVPQALVLRAIRWRSRLRFLVGRSRPVPDRS